MYYTYYIVNKNYKTTEKKVRIGCEQQQQKLAAFTN